jgi:flagellar biosynthesis protein
LKGCDFVEKRKKAAALKYEQSYEAPIVTAAGMGYVADKIIEKAEKNDVPIVKNEELANLLNNVDLGESIPYELYDTVAEIIAYIMDVDKSLT